MFGNVSAAAIAARFSVLAERHGGVGAADRAELAQRKLMHAIAEREPATLGEVASALGRGAPAVSRAVDALVRAGMVERTQDPGNRRRLSLRLTDAGRKRLGDRAEAHGPLMLRLERLAQSELRAVERAIEILERLPA